jgi:TM2 domain-containing membrane protein YozV
VTTTSTGAQKSVGVAYALWFCAGFLGAHLFYLGKTGKAVSYIFTLGWLGIGLLIDLFTLSKQVAVANGQAS